MEELRKINRIIDREYPEAHRETLVVLDGTTGQNALAQAKQFGEVADITGIILTKLDGTAKGGIAIVPCPVATVSSLNGCTKVRPFSFASFNAYWHASSYTLPYKTTSAP